MVVPQRHDQNHGLGQGGAHLGQAALVLERGLVAEGGLLRVAVVRGDGVVLGGASDGAVRVGDQLAVLDVEALDLGQRAVGLDELGHNGEDRVGVDGLAGAVEGCVALSVAVEVTPIRVALAGIS